MAYFIPRFHYGAVPEPAFVCDSPESKNALAIFEASLQRLRDESNVECGHGSNEREGENDATGGDQNDRLHVKRDPMVESPMKIYRKRTKDRQRKVVFELCQKSFELKNISGPYSLYRLCRTWVHGRDDCRPYNSAEQKQDEEGGDRSPSAQDMEPTESTKLATYTLPPPSPKRETSPIIQQRPEKPVFDDLKSSVEESAENEAADVEMMLRAYIPYWKQVKRIANKESRLAFQQYHKSFEALKTMYIPSQGKN
uniref:Uncharacterized protein n=1 Tax=Trichuris muris TaxID=70415 RepID=A0A5S6QLI5_TRIMR